MIAVATASLAGPFKGLFDNFFSLYLQDFIRILKKFIHTTRNAYCRLYLSNMSDYENGSLSGSSSEETAATSGLRTSDNLLKELRMPKVIVFDLGEPKNCLILLKVAD
jgi:hypothetical protein